ncbi:hypothetical protein EB796_005646 [Bugula neritina]|uniref:ShKT domain-containing protein n=1 Tax=Bugula neritina TaxID=10212 RepID=A0A7J7KDV5_BUGNE|nr:hypothetical protein EB796_005646 [Bugula neritina]
MATEELFDLLIRLKFIDSDSLHHKPVLATRPPVDCIDRVPSCDKRIKEYGHCDPSSHFFHWMHENCYRSCGLTHVYTTLRTTTQAFNRKYFEKGMLAIALCAEIFSSVWLLNREIKAA